MPHCVAFIPARHRDQAWQLCARLAAPGDSLCAAHRDALDGAAMGIFHSHLHYNAQPTTSEAKRLVRNIAITPRKHREAKPRTKRQDFTEAR